MTAYTNVTAPDARSLGMTRVWNVRRTWNTAAQELWRRTWTPRKERQL